MDKAGICKTQHHKVNTVKKLNKNTPHVCPDFTGLFPEAFDAKVYREKNFNDEALKSHYMLFGKHEGRYCSHAAHREYLAALIYDVTPALEIGPFSAPVLNPATAKFFDVLSQEGLMQRARKIGEPYNPDTVPRIDYVSPTGDLTIINEKFDLIFSSHCIEHQPNLIKHFLDIEKILNPGGVYVFIIPDFRFCFDHYRNPSHIGDVLSAYHNGHKFHTLETIIEERTRATHNFAHRHWQGDHGNLPEADPQKISRLVEEWKSAKDENKYIDVHAWKLTPDIFKEIVTLLKVMGYINLSLLRIYNTPRPRFEFCGVLKKNQ